MPGRQRVEMFANSDFLDLLRLMDANHIRYMVIGGSVPSVRDKGSVDTFAGHVTRISGGANHWQNLATCSRLALERRTRGLGAVGIGRVLRYNRGGIEDSRRRT